MSEPKTVPGLRVSAKVEGFRRAGRAWSAEPTDVPLSAFTKEQVAALRADAGLVVIDVEVAEGDEAATASDGAKPSRSAKK